MPSLGVLVVHLNVNASMNIHPSDPVNYGIHNNISCPRLFLHANPLNPVSRSASSALKRQSEYEYSSQRPRKLGNSQ